MTGRPVALTPREFNLLWALCEKPGRVLTHKLLLQTVWGHAHGNDVDREGSQRH